MILLQGWLRQRYKSLQETSTNLRRQFLRYVGDITVGNCSSSVADALILWLVERTWIIRWALFGYLFEGFARNRKCKDRYPDNIKRTVHYRS